MALTHTVAQGECLASIARTYHSWDWRTIYNHANNSDFRQKRTNPNVIYPGDRIYIPDLNPVSKDAVTDTKHRYKLKWQPTSIWICLEDGKGTPFASKKYRLEIEGKIYEGTTGEDGSMRVEIPPTAASGELTVWMDDDQYDDCTWRLKLGHLDPIKEVSGVQGRLNNLGCICGKVDGIVGPRTKSAVQAFQARVGLPVTGAIDEPLRQKLREAYDKT
jgi:N-acetylmuramoyl-L-alanine amidase